MRFKGLDLNLLQALDVLLDERHVSRAAERMNVTQPAMSGALTRLRQYFNDPLLNQHGRRMVPTPHALSLAPRLKRLLSDVDSLVAQLSQFDPATSERTFKIVASDYVVALLFSRIARLLGDNMSKLSFEIRDPSERSTEQFEQGEIDLLIAPEYLLNTKHSVLHLYNEEQIVLGSKNNPILAGDQISEEDFFRSAHVTVELGRIRRGSYVESFFSRMDRKRRVAFSVSSFMSALEVVAGTSMITVTHRSLAKLYTDRFNLKIVRLPFDLPPMKQMIVCHEARLDDPGVQWLRQCIGAVVGKTQALQIGP